MSPGASQLRSRNTNTPSTPVDDNEEGSIDDFVLRDGPEEVLFSTCTTDKSNPLEFQNMFNLSIWKDPETKDQKISVGILLLTGIGEKRVILRYVFRTKIF